MIKEELGGGDWFEREQKTNSILLVGAKKSALATEKVNGQP